MATEYIRISKDLLDRLQGVAKHKLRELPLIQIPDTNVIIRRFKVQQVTSLHGKAQLVLLVIERENALPNRRFPPMEQNNTVQDNLQYSAKIIKQENTKNLNSEILYQEVELNDNTLCPQQSPFKPFILKRCFSIVCSKNQRLMDISLRTKQLNNLFSYDKKTELEESHLEIIPFRFTQTRDASEIDKFQKGLTLTGFCPMKTIVSKRTNLSRMPYSRPRNVKRIMRRLFCSRSLSI